jgi:hypothetical protein
MQSVPPAVAGGYSTLQIPARLKQAVLTSLSLQLGISLTRLFLLFAGRRSLSIESGYAKTRTLIYNLAL